MLGTLFALICGAPIVVNAGPVLRAVDSIAVGMKGFACNHLTSAMRKIVIYHQPTEKDGLIATITTLIRVRAKNFHTAVANLGRV